MNAFNPDAIRAEAITITDGSGAIRTAIAHAPAGLASKDRSGTT